MRPERTNQPSDNKKNSTSPPQRRRRFNRPSPLHIEKTETTTVAATASPTLFGSRRPIIHPEEDLSLEFIHKLLILIANGETKHNEAELKAESPDGENFTITYDKRVFNLSRVNDKEGGDKILGKGAFATVYLYEIFEVDKKGGEKKGESIQAAAKFCSHDHREDQKREISKHIEFCSDGSPYIAQFRGDLSKILRKHAFFLDLYNMSLEQFINEKPMSKISKEQEKNHVMLLRDNIVACIVAGLNHLHNPTSPDQKPAFHLDLTLSNVLANVNHGDVSNAVLTDFGCARTLEEIKEKGIIGVGTFSLSSPEKFLMGPRTLDVETCSKITDVWALGLLIKKLLGLQSPSSNTVKQTTVPGISVFEREKIYRDWAEDYPTIFKIFIQNEKAELLSSSHSRKFLWLNNLANCLLAPIEHRPSIKDLIDPKTHKLNIEKDWGEELKYLPMGTLSASTPSLTSRT